MSDLSSKERVSDKDLERYRNALVKGATAFQYCHPDTIVALTRIIVELQKRRAADEPEALYTEKDVAAMVAAALAAREERANRRGTCGNCEQDEHNGPCTSEPPPALRTRLQKRIDDCPCVGDPDFPTDARCEECKADMQVLAGTAEPAPTSPDAEDAARYRWLKEHDGDAACRTVLHQWLENAYDLDYAIRLAEATVTKEESHGSGV